jgi:hypothetical protein
VKLLCLLMVGIQVVIDFFNKVTWESVSAGANVVLALLGVATILYVRCEWKKRLRDEKVAAVEKKRQILVDVLRGYFKEYRSEEFGKAIEALRVFQRECGNDPQKIVESYVYLRKNVPPFPRRNLHYQRRMVSAFFQELAIYANESEDIRNEVCKVWLTGDLGIIKDVLEPIELEAIPISLGNPPMKKPFPAFKAMLNLYEGSKKVAK